MLKKRKYYNTLFYNNYQVYERAAFHNFLENKTKQNYFLYDAVGDCCSLLKFYKSETESPKSYQMYDKHLDDEVDTGIEKLKKEKTKVIVESGRYIIFERSPENLPDSLSLALIDKQNGLLGISIKKAFFFISSLLLLSVIAFALKAFMLQNGNFLFNSLSLSLCITLFICFLIYFIGDIHDFIKGKGISTQGSFYFTSRTKVKDILYRVGDILGWLILLSFILITVLIWLVTKDAVIGLTILRMWIISSIGFLFRLRFRRSYVSLLLIAALLAVFSF